MRSMTAGIDYTSRDYESIKQDMIAKLVKEIPEYTDTSETDAGIVLLECLAMGIDIVSFYQDVQANECMLATCEQRRNALLWCNLLGYSPLSTIPAHVMMVFALNSANNINETVIPAGTIVKTVPTEVQASILFTTEKDLVIPVGMYGNEQDEDGNYLYQVSAVHGVWVVNETLGSSDGSKNQEFSLSYYPVYTDSISIEVLEGENNWVQWGRVPSFADSNYTSRHYVLSIMDNNQAVIQFGDGNTGRIPPVYSGGIRATYINGGGTEGNVTAGTITLMHTSNPLVRMCANPEEVYIRGRDKETLESIKKNAPAYNRVKWGALTSEDFEDLARSLFKEVLYVRAVPVDFTDDYKKIDDIDLYIMLYDNAELTEEKAAEIKATMDDRAIVGVRNINIKEMRLFNIDIRYHLVLEDNFTQSTAKERVEDRIKKFFEFGNLNVSEDFSITEIEAAVYKDVPGVRSFRILEPSELVVIVEDGYVATLNSVDGIVSGGVIVNG